ncbi:hypothetical protein EGI32_01935 [Ferruginibacter sp. HRS2-29]|nr:hypothetical protein [Ferruginibacter sp. HRS2-29]
MHIFLLHEFDELHESKRKPEIFTPLKKTDSFTIHYSLFTIHYSPFTIPYLFSYNQILNNDTS